MIVDVFNLIWRKKSASPPNLIRSVINTIEDEIRPRVSKEGTLYLLFDPLPQDDLGIGKTFTYTGFRKEILPSYKKDRVGDPLVQKTAEIVKKYYLYRGDGIKLSFSETYEADDYVEPLMEALRKSGTESIAIVSTDEDLAAFVGDDCVLINDRWDKPFTRYAFKMKFKFEPTYAANVIYKSLYGDSSDGVTGAIFIKKARFSVPIKQTCYEAIKFVSLAKTSLDDFLKRWASFSYMSVAKKEERDPIEELYFHMEGADQRAPVIESFITNVKVVRSSLSGRDITKFLTSHSERPNVNSVLHKSIFGMNFKEQFGRT